MNLIPQQHPLGCFIASTAMVLDMTYEDVAQTIPLQDQGGEEWWQPVLASLQALAAPRGKVVVDLEPPFIVQPGMRYLAQVPTNIPGFYHILAIDESGIAFNPD